MAQSLTDRQLGGYTRHRRAYDRGSWGALAEEVGCSAMDSDIRYDWTSTESHSVISPETTESYPHRPARLVTHT